MDASALQRRGVIHLDLDCFYAQVEAKRLGIDGSVPLAVQQWSGLIAVNYPARHKGVKRHLNVVEAKKLVPELVCVHVETRGGDGRLQAEDGDEEHGAVQVEQLAARLGAGVAKPAEAHPVLLQLRERGDLQRRRAVPAQKLRAALIA